MNGGEMDARWYKREDMRKRLIAFGRVMQGADPYDVVIDADSSRCPSGYCSFTRKRIAVNPIAFPVSPDEQYQLTKALLVHEAGHRRFTTAKRLPSLIREVANILEDERVERRMCEQFVGVHWLVRQLSEQFYERARPVDRASDLPDEVVLYFLQLRWAERIGCPVKGSLSARNQQLWESIAPLVYESWQANSSRDVDDNAAQIVVDLGFDEPSIHYFNKETTWPN
jgi:hypothetical protein